MDSMREEWWECYGAHLYLRLLRAFPVLLRLWWTDQCDRQTAALVEKWVFMTPKQTKNMFFSKGRSTTTNRYTTGVISPVLIESELAGVTAYRDSSGAEDNFTIKVSKVTREVHATYQKDEMTLSGQFTPFSVAYIIFMSQTMTPNLCPSWLCSCVAVSRIISLTFSGDRLPQ